MIKSRVENGRQKTKELKELERKNKKEERRKKRKKSLMIFILLIGLLLIYARYIEPSMLKVKEYKIDTIEVDDTLNGLKIVHFSDIHYGMTIGEKELIKIIDKINSLKPDLVIFTGDLTEDNSVVDSTTKKILIENLKNINANLGKYAIIGNHDYENKYYESIFLDSEFTYLNNNYDLIYNKSNNPILIYGLDDVIFGSPDITKLDDPILQEIPYKIVLVHEPDYIEKFVYKYDVDLVLSGHSHNGQVRIPFIGATVLPIGSKNLYEEYYNINNTDIYISNGIGTSTLKFRFNSIPSINFYRITKK